MKKFKDLVFHPNGTGGINSRMDFDNGFSISVIAGGIAYSSPRFQDKEDPNFFSTFEIAVFAPDGDWGTKQFAPNHHDDVLGWQDRDEITALMLLIQSK